MNPINEPKVKRLASNIAKLLASVLRKSAELEKSTKATRMRINTDLNALVEGMKPEERGLLLSAIAVEAQRIFDAVGSPKVTISGGCAGTTGLGVRASDGGNYAGACVTGSLSEGITGGGVEAGFTY